MDGWMDGCMDSDGHKEKLIYGQEEEEVIPEQETEEAIRKNELRLALTRRLKKDLMETEQERMRKLEVRSSRWWWS